jgi:outer membrane protein OmpA-like peptidoglycan-associated protein
MTARDSTTFADSGARGHASEPAVQASAVSVPLATPAVAASVGIASGTPATTTPVSEITSHETAAFQVDEAGNLRFAGAVANEEQRITLMSALKNKFGAGRFTADVSVAPESRADWIEHLDTLLELMSVRGAEFELHGSAIELAGAAITANWPSRIQQAFGASWHVSTFNAVERVDTATQAFRRAMTAALDGDQPCRPENVVRVLNAQVVDFARSSAHVPATAKGPLADSALLLKTCANAGHPVKLRIAAYTDSAGDPDALLQLARKRANAVRAFFVANGVPGSLMSADGYGPEKPVVSNLTSIGRFENRRVEFIVQQ